MSGAITKGTSVPVKRSNKRKVKRETRGEMLQESLFAVEDDVKAAIRKPEETTS